RRGCSRSLRPWCSATPATSARGSSAPSSSTRSTPAGSRASSSSAPKRCSRPARPPTRPTMNPLAERFPGLSTLPFVPLVDAPTEVHELSRLSAMTGVSCWVKREDKASPRYGGNKVRKLEWLMGDAREKHADVLVTTGAIGPNHVLATAIHGIKAGLGVHALLSPQPTTRHVEENLRADLAVGATLMPIRASVLAPLAMRHHAATLERKGFRPYVIPHGGSSPIGILGYVNAGLELAAQIERGEVP